MNSRKSGTCQQQIMVHKDVNELVWNLYFLRDEGSYDVYYDQFVKLVFPMERYLTPDSEEFVLKELLKLFVDGLQEETKQYVCNPGPIDFLDAMNLANYYEDVVKYKRDETAVRNYETEEKYISAISENVKLDEKMENSTPMVLPCFLSNQYAYPSHTLQDDSIGIEYSTATNSIRKELHQDPMQTVKGSGDKQIKQDLQDVVESVVSSVLKSSLLPDPIIFAHETMEMNTMAIAEMQKTIVCPDRKLEDNKPKVGLHITEDIGRLQRIQNSDLEELRELGSKTFETVYHGKWRGLDVAIKRISDRCFAGKPSEQEKMRADFWIGACKLADWHSPNIVTFYGIVLDGPGGSVGIVTEYMVNGSLRNALQRNGKSLDHRERLLITMNVASGMEYLHGNNIVHFDLKSDNLHDNLRNLQFQTPSPALLLFLEFVSHTTSRGKKIILIFFQNMWSGRNPLHSSAFFWVDVRLFMWEKRDVDPSNGVVDLQYDNKSPPKTPLRPSPKPPWTYPNSSFRQTHSLLRSARPAPKPPWNTYSRAIQQTGGVHSGHYNSTQSKFSGNFSRILHQTGGGRGDNRYQLISVAAAHKDLILSNSFNGKGTPMSTPDNKKKWGCGTTVSMANASPGSPFREIDSQIVRGRRRTWRPEKNSRSPHQLRLSFARSRDEIVLREEDLMQAEKHTHRPPPLREHA